MRVIQSHFKLLHKMRMKQSEILMLLQTVKEKKYLTLMKILELAVRKFQICLKKV